MMTIIESKLSKIDREIDKLEIERVVDCISSLEPECSLPWILRKRIYKFAELLIEKSRFVEPKDKTFFGTVINKYIRDQKYYDKTIVHSFFRSIQTSESHKYRRDKNETLKSNRYNLFLLYDLRGIEFRDHRDDFSSPGLGRVIETIPQHYASMSIGHSEFIQQHDSVPTTVTIPQPRVAEFLEVSGTQVPQIGIPLLPENQGFTFSSTRESLEP